MKFMLLGVWVAAVALGSSYAAVYWKAVRAAAMAAPAPVEYQKTRAISVPMLSGGVVQGYVVAQFAYTIDPAVLKQISVPPEPFLLDEAFRTIYADGKLDFKHIEKYDLGKLTADLVQKTNARLGANLIKDVLVQDFNYVSKEENAK